MRKQHSGYHKTESLCQYFAFKNKLYWTRNEKILHSLQKDNSMKKMTQAGEDNEIVLS